MAPQSSSSVDGASSRGPLRVRDGRQQIRTVPPPFPSLYGRLNLMDPEIASTVTVDLLSRIACSCALLLADKLV